MAENETIEHVDHPLDYDEMRARLDRCGSLTVNVDISGELYDQYKADDDEEDIVYSAISSDFCYNGARIEVADDSHYPEKVTMTVTVEPDLSE